MCDFTGPAATVARAILLAREGIHQAREVSAARNVQPMERALARAERSLFEAYQLLHAQADNYAVLPPAPTDADALLKELRR